jgi:hypothetical protein
MAYGHCCGLGTSPFLVGNRQKDNFFEKNLSPIPFFSNKNIAKICPNSFLGRVSPHSCLLVITGHYFNGPLQKCHQLRRNLFCAKIHPKAKQFSENGIFCHKISFLEKKQIRLKGPEKKFLWGGGCRHIYVYWLQF